jgi:hypothetical protein
MLTNPSTPFDEDGHADIIGDLRRLFMMIAGGTNDLNASAVATEQDTFEEETPYTNAEIDALIDELIDAALATITTSSTAVAVSAYRSGALQGVNASATNTVVFNATEYDSDSLYNASTGKVTLAEDGVYEIEAVISVYAAAGVAEHPTAVANLITSTNHYGTESLDIGAAYDAYKRITIRAIQSLTAGQEIYVALQNNSASTQYNVGGTFTVSRIGD